MSGQQLAYSQKDAATQLGISASHFVRHVRPDLKPVFISGRIVFKHADLARWLERQ